MGNGVLRTGPWDMEFPGPTRRLFGGPLGSIPSPGPSPSAHAAGDGDSGLTRTGVGEPWLRSIPDTAYSRPTLATRISCDPIVC